jgi:DNA adenine methylase
MRKDGPRRLVHFTPLRYPGGKGKLAAYVKEIIRNNKLYDSDYVEPYAGGSAIALELLFQEYVSQIHINDVSRAVYAFWKSVLNDTDELCRRVKNTKLSVHSWDRQKRIFSRPDDHDDLELGFATFFLNRTNRSGILNGGIIGGRDQTGEWKIDARYNAPELVFRIEAIAKMRNRIKLTKRDALSFLQSGLEKWPKKTLVYLDPPYYHKGGELYYDYYKPADHVEVAKFVSNKMKKIFWIVSYDNAREIRQLYERYRNIVYNVGYTARDQRMGKEIMFFSPKLEIPNLVGPIQQVGKIKQAA